MRVLVLACALLSVAIAGCGSGDDGGGGGYVASPPPEDVADDVALSPPQGASTQPAVAPAQLFVL